MEIDIISFGKVKDIIRNQKISVLAEDTDKLKSYLEQQFPGLSETRYMLALNNKLVQANVPVSPGSTIAIMPPFSGG